MLDLEAQQISIRLKKDEEMLLKMQLEAKEQKNKEENDRLKSIMIIKENTIKKYKKQISEVKSANKMEREGLKDKESDLKNKMVEMEINAKVVECDLTNYETLKTH